MCALELKAYDVFKTYFKKEEDAQLMIDFIEQKSEQKVIEKQLATKTDIKELELKIEQSKVEMWKRFWGYLLY